MNTKDTKTDPPKCCVCDESQAKRGLCVKHYEQFRRNRAKFAKEQGEELAAAWEKRLLASGKILPNRQGNKAVDDPFGNELDLFLAEIERAAKKQASKESRQQPKTTKKRQA